MGKILIIDDDAQVLAMLRQTLEHEGYEVVAASDGNEGLRNPKCDLFKDTWATGVGIREEDQEIIFSPFEQIGNQPATEPGTGLGLAICKQYAELMCGHITVESEVGDGTAFTIYIPAHEKDVREMKPIELPRPELPEIRTKKFF